MLGIMMILYNQIYNLFSFNHFNRSHWWFQRPEKVQPDGKRDEQIFQVCRGIVPATHKLLAVITLKVILLASEWLGGHKVSWM